MSIKGVIEDLQKRKESIKEENLDLTSKNDRDETWSSSWSGTAHIVMVALREHQEVTLLEQVV